MWKLLIAPVLLVIIIILFPDLNTPDMNTIDEFLQEQVDKGQTPSIQYAYFDMDSVHYQASFGYKNLLSKEKADKHATYHLFSVTKTFTALAILQMARSGKIDLNKSVKYYMPAFPYGDEITTLQLLNHTSGIPNPIPLKWIHLEEEHKTFNRDAFFLTVFNKHSKTEFQPGTKFKYSNLGYVILGQLIEKMSGSSYEEYIKENIIDVCKADSGELTFTISRSTHATGYHEYWTVTNAMFGLLLDKNKFMGDRQGKWKPFNFFYNNGTSYGGLLGSANGLIKYAQVLLQEDSPLINNQFKKLLFTESMVQNIATGMSLSWYTGELKGIKYFAHAGGGGGYYVELRLYPELKSGSVIMYNRSGLKDVRMQDKADLFFIGTKENGR